jgi:translation initiation factor IF-3
MTRLESALRFISKEERTMKVRIWIETRGLFGTATMYTDRNLEDVADEIHKIESYDSQKVIKLENISEEE